MLLFTRYVLHLPSTTLHIRRKKRGSFQKAHKKPAPVILPLASDGGCQFTIMVRGFPSLLTTVTSFGGEVGTANKQKNQTLLDAYKFTHNHLLKCAFLQKNEHNQ